MHILLLILKIIGIAYLLVEVFSFTLAGIPILTVAVVPALVRTLVIKVMGNKACRLGVHQYQYYSRKHYVEGGPRYLKEIDISHRECMGECGKESWSVMPPGARMFKGWTEGKLTGVLKLKEV